MEEPQNLSTPVTVVGEKNIAAMISAYIQTTGDITPTHQIIIDSGDRGVKMYQQQRLPSLTSLPPLKKVRTWFSSLRTENTEKSDSHTFVYFAGSYKLFHSEPVHKVSVSSWSGGGSHPHPNDHSSPYS